jgi:hypothetical protein
VVTFNEASVMVRLFAAKQVFEIFLRFILEDVTVSGPYSIGQLETVDSVLLPSNDSLGMEEGTIFVSEFDPVFSGFLVP